MPTIETDLEGFKKIVADFVKLLPEVKDLDTLDNMFKCVSLAWLGITFKREPDEVLAFSVFEYASNKNMDKEMELMGLG